MAPTRIGQRGAPRVGDTEAHAEPSVAPSSPKDESQWPVRPPQHEPTPSTDRTWPTDYPKNDRPTAHSPTRPLILAAHSVGNIGRRVCGMSEEPDFYETTYSTVDTDVQTRVRSETYDADLGQAGWLQASGAREFASWLGADVTSLLDVACGSGGNWRSSRQNSAPRCSESTTIRTRSGRRTNGALAAAPSRSPTRTSRSPSRTDPSTSSSRTFGAPPPRPHRGLAPWARVLRLGGQVLYTEGLVLAGPVSNEEIRRRTFMGSFVITPLGANERAIDSAGLELLRAEDRVRRRRRGGRSDASRSGALPRRADPHRRQRGVRDVPGLPWVAVSLAVERRLTRWVFHARKPG